MNKKNVSILDHDLTLTATKHRLSEAKTTLKAKCSGT